MEFIFADSVLQKYKKVHTRLKKTHCCGKDKIKANKMAITVAILINGRPILARSAVNITPEQPYSAVHKYKVDDGSVVEHIRSDGCVVLAHKLLDTIKEVTK